MATSRADQPPPSSSLYLSRRGLVKGSAALGAVLAGQQVLTASSLPIPRPIAGFDLRDTMWFNTPGLSREGAARIATNMNAKTDAARPGGRPLRAALFALSESDAMAAFDRAMANGVVASICLGKRSAEFPRTVDWAAEVNARDDANRVHFSERVDGDMHAKLVLYPDGSLAEGSFQPSGGGVHRQWNSMMYLVNRPQVYDELVNWHEAMMTDRPYIAPTKRLNGAEVQVAPIYGVDKLSADIDPQIQLLDRLAKQHRAPRGRHDLAGMKIRFAQHMFAGRRGEWTTDKLVELAHRGAQVDVIYGFFTDPAFVDRLKSAGCQVHAGYMGGLDSEGVPKMLVHWKHLSVEWQDAASVAHHTVSEGSDNCTTGTFYSDQLRLVLDDHPVIGRQWIEQYDRAVRFFGTNSNPITPVPASPPALSANAAHNRNTPASAAVNR